MLLSKTCSYEIRAALYIAVHKDRKFISIRDISAELGVSFHFLTKILQILTQKNIMVSFKGPNGGVTLARSADSIRLTEIVEAIDGPKVYEECLLGLDQCGDENPCPLHRNWAGIRQQIQALFDDTSLAVIAAKIKTNEFRITNLVKKQ